MFTVPADVTLDEGHFAVPFRIVVLVNQHVVRRIDKGPL
jgi:hypothetical protein